jgi:hypothetical protein
VECCPTFQWLCKVAGYWRELENAVAHINPEHPKHVQWGTSSEYADHDRAETFSASSNCVQILVYMGLCIIKLKHEVMAVDEWHNLKLIVGD